MIFVYKFGKIKLISNWFLKSVCLSFTKEKILVNTYIGKKYLFSYNINRYGIKYSLIFSQIMLSGRIHIQIF